MSGFTDFAVTFGFFVKRACILALSPCLATPLAATWANFFGAAFFMANDFGFRAIFLAPAGALAGLTIFVVAFLAAGCAFAGLTILVVFAGTSLAAGVGAVALVGSAGGASGEVVASFGTSVLSSDYV